MDRMTTEHILSYGYLTEGERRGVEAYVAQHPEYAPVLEEARILFETIRIEHTGRDEGLTDDEILAHIVDTRMGHPGQNDARIRGALDRSAAFRSRYDALAGQLDRLSSALDPLAHFEHLSGYSWPEATQREDRPSAAGPRVRVRRRVAVGVGFAAVVLLTVGIFSAHLRAIDRLAYVASEELDLPGYDAIQRGTSSPLEVPPDVRYRHALSYFKHSRSAGLGLFPRYDAALLARAEEELTQVIAAEPVTSFLSQEARFTLARVYLADNQREEARDVLASVASSESHRAASARDLLERITP